MASAADGTIIAYTLAGKPIYADFKHPSHQTLTSGELQSPMFEFFKRGDKHLEAMRKYPSGSPQHRHHKTQMLQYNAVYKSIAKLWRRALMREKKALSRK